MPPMPRPEMPDEQQLARMTEDELDRLAESFDAYAEACAAEAAELRQIGATAPTTTAPAGSR
jgi:hypothetical protein